MPPAHSAALSFSSPWCFEARVNHCPYLDDLAEPGDFLVLFDQLQKERRRRSLALNKVRIYLFTFLLAIQKKIIHGPAERKEIMSQEMRLFLAIGFCGSFTTFSPFAAENLNLFQIGSSWVLLANALANLVLGVTAVYMGVVLTRLG